LSVNTPKDKTALNFRLPQP